MTRAQLYIFLVTIDLILAVTAILAAALLEFSSATGFLAAFVGESFYIGVLAMLDDQTRMQGGDLTK